MLAYLKLHKKFSEDNSIEKCASSDDMFRFSNIVEIQKEHEIVIERIISYENEMGKKKRTDTETEYVSVEDSLNIFRSASSKTKFSYNVPNTFD